MSEEKSDKWVMPEPIFRRSTGELVKPSADPFLIDPEPDTLDPAYREEDPSVDPEADTLIPNKADQAVDDPDHVELELPDDPLTNLYAPPEGFADDPEPPAPAAVPTVEIEPQPYISEQFFSEEIIVEEVRPKAKAKSGSAFFIAGVLLLLAAAVGFVVIVYYLFFATRPDTSGF